MTVLRMQQHSTENERRAEKREKNGKKWRKEGAKENRLAIDRFSNSELSRPL